MIEYESLKNALANANSVPYSLTEIWDALDTMAGCELIPRKLINKLRVEAGGFYLDGDGNVRDRYDGDKIVSGINQVWF